MPDQTKELAKELFGIRKELQFQTNLALVDRAVNYGVISMDEYANYIRVLAKKRFPLMRFNENGKNSGGDVSENQIEEEWNKCLGT